MHPQFFICVVSKRFYSLLLDFEDTKQSKTIIELTKNSS